MKKILDSRNCEKCGKIFSPWDSKSRYCSRQCAYKNRLKRGTKVKCLQCGKVFYNMPSQTRKCCSSECAGKNKRDRRWRNCPICNKEFYIYPSRVKKFSNFYCSRECFKKAYKGDKTSNYKGGIYHSAGYTLILNPEHPRSNQNGYVFEHILVWEQANNKALPEGWIIHHLNGIKDDNRFVNLIALPNREHRHVLQAKAKRIQELEALLRNQRVLI